MSDIVRELDQGMRNWLVIGESRWSVDRAVEALVNWGKSRCGPVGFNLGVWSGAESTAVSAFSTARTLPMMADLRVVVVRDVEQADDVFWSTLLGYLEESSTSTLLIIAGEGFPKVRKGGSNWATRTNNALKKLKGVRRLELPELAPVEFARQHAASLGKQLGQVEAQLLVELIGKDLSQLALEIEKVALYAGDDVKISEEALRATCSVLAEADRWELTSGIAAKHPERAIAALHRLLEAGESPHALLAQVMWQLRIILQVSELVVQGKKDAEIRQAIGPTLRADLLPKIRAGLGPKPAGSAAILEQVARANRGMNSRRVGDRHIFEDLVVTLCRI